MRRGLSIAVAVMVLSACGGGEAALTPEEQAVATAIEAKIASEISEDDDLLVETETRRCFAEGLVGLLGLTRLGELGVTAAGVGESEAVFGGMTESELRGVAGVAGDCVDLSASFRANLEAGGLSSDSAACFTGRLEGSDFYEQAFVAGLLGQEFEPVGDALATMISAATECLTPAELDAFFGPG